MAIASVLFFGGRDVIDGNLTIGEFVLFNSLLLQLVWPLEALGWILNLAQRAIASASRAFAWLDAVQPLPEAEQPAQLPEGGLDVRFEDVCFAYAGGLARALRPRPRDQAPGSIVAVCGETGSGKSTMLNLLSRFYDPDSGSVRVGGVELSDAAQGRPAHGRRARHAAPRAVLAAAARQPLRGAARTPPRRR